MTLEELRKALKEKAEGLAALQTKANADGATEEDVKALEAACKEIEDLERKIKANEAAEQIRARSAKPANAPVDSDLPEAQVKQDLKPAEKVGLIIQGMMKAYVEDGSRGERAMLKSIVDLGYAKFADDYSKMRKKQLVSTSASAGGVLVPEDMSADIIKLLYPNTTFLQGGPRRIPMPNGNYKLPAGATGATAAYRGEAQRMNVSQPTFRAINMSAKLLAGIVKVSNQLVRYSLPDVEAFVRSDLSMAMGVTMDQAAYMGTGVADTPLGITNIPGTTAQTATNSASPTVAQVEADARVLELSMSNVNLPTAGRAWVMAPRTLSYLQDMRDGNGNRIYPELSADTPRWRRKPVLETTQIPIDGGVGTDESELFLVNFGNVLYGDAMAIQFAMSDQATIFDGTNTTYLFQQGVTAIKAEMEHDFDLEYNEAVAVLEAVKWGS